MKIKKIISIILLVIYLITMFANYNNSKANIKEGDTLLLKADHECANLVQFYMESEKWWSYKVIWYVCYEEKETLNKYPAFCVEPQKNGVGISYEKYNTSLTKDKDNTIWRILNKGYMGSNYKDWNLEYDDDLYSSTKIAIQSYIEGKNPKKKYRVGQREVDGLKIEEIQRRGTKVLDVAEELYEYGMTGKEIYEEPNLLVDMQGKGKLEVLNNKDYYVQDYNVVANKDLDSYEVKISNFISGTKILDSNYKEKSKFNENKFKIAIPVEYLENDVSGIIEIKNAKIKTNPVYYCKSYIEGTQNYVTYASGYEYVDTNKKLELEANKSDLIIKKVDKETKKQLQGIKFKITNAKGEDLGKYVTDENGQIKLNNLKPGIIYVQEIEAPNEYKINNEKIEVVLRWGETSKIEISNELKKGALKIIKVDSGDNSKTLEGVEFDLLDEKNNIVKHVITNEYGQAIIEDLNKGIYTLKEKKTIEGYILDEAIYKIEVKPNKTFEVKIENEKIPEIPEKPDLPKLPKTGF